jgi:hypothetical protein
LQELQKIANRHSFGANKEINLRKVSIFVSTRKKSMQ